MSSKNRGKRLVFLLLLGVTAALVAYGCFQISEKKFQVSGSITASVHILQKIQRPNTVLFIVATNSGGVPVAVKRIINPQLPVEYHLDNEDLILPGPVWNGPLRIKVHVNTHGKVGLTIHGDLVGTYPGSVYSGEQNVHIVIDSEV
jgi:hypothetical protein